jgi:small-conductance mechanosensitive channel
METSSNKLVKLILGEVALLFILVILITFVGSYVGVDSFRDVFMNLLAPAVTIIFVLIATLLIIMILQPAFRKALSQFLPDYEVDSTWLFVKYAIWTASLLILTFLLLSDTLSLSIFIGLLIVLFIFIFHKALINFSGWLYIIFQHHMKMGDLVEINGIRGRIVGISIMSTKLAEVEEFFGEEHHSNRLVTIPNSYVFTNPIFSTSTEKYLVWDEIKVLLPANVDHMLAREIITQVATNIVGPIMRKHRQKMVSKTSSPLKVPQNPHTLISLEREGVLIILSYFCPISDRSELRSAISENILAEFSKEGIELSFVQIPT